MSDPVICATMGRLPTIENKTGAGILKCKIFYINYTMLISLIFVNLEFDNGLIQYPVLGQAEIRNCSDTCLILLFFVYIE